MWGVSSVAIGLFFWCNKNIDFKKIFHAGLEKKKNKKILIHDQGQRETKRGDTDPPETVWVGQHRSRFVQLWVLAQY